jgi:hypothetical protein
MEHNPLSAHEKIQWEALKQQLADRHAEAKKTSRGWQGEALIHLLWKLILEWRLAEQENDWMLIRLKLANPPNWLSVLE